MSDTTHPDPHGPTTSRTREPVPIICSVPIGDGDHPAAGTTSRPDRRWPAGGRPRAGLAEGGR